MALVRCYYISLFFFINPYKTFEIFYRSTPWCISIIDSIDSFWQIGLPMIYMTDIVIAAALVYLLGRRIFNLQVKYVSLPSDYFPLFLILGIITTGMLMRYFSRVDITSIKELALGLAYLKPTVPDGVGSLFYIHFLPRKCSFCIFPIQQINAYGWCIFKSY